MATETPKTKAAIRKSIHEGNERFKKMVSEVQSTPKAREIVQSLIGAFKSESDSLHDFEDLTEIVTWLYVHEYTGKNLEKLFAEASGCKRASAVSISEESVSAFILRVRPQVRAEMRRIEANTVLSCVNSALKDFLSDTKATFEDPDRLTGMMKAMEDLMLRHKTFREDTVDTKRRASFACYVILHVKQACDILREHIEKGDLRERPAYREPKTRKLEEVRIVLSDISPIDLAAMCDGL